MKGLCVSFFSLSFSLSSKKTIRHHKITRTCYSRRVKRQIFLPLKNVGGYVKYEDYIPTCIKYKSSTGDRNVIT